jgi:hypothetical protein
VKNVFFSTVSAGQLRDAGFVLVPLQLVRSSSDSHPCFADSLVSQFFFT